VLLNTKLFDKRRRVLSPPLKNPQPKTPVVSLNGRSGTIFEQVKYLGVLLHASLKDDIQRKVKHYCAANELRNTFAQTFTALENTLFRAYCLSI